MSPPRRTLGDYLGEVEPVGVMFEDLVSIVHGGKRERDGFAVLSDQARALLDVCCFDGEMANGGMDQFFYNSTGGRCLETLAALRAVDATLSARLLEQAMALFPGGVVPGDCTTRRTMLVEFDETNPRFCGEIDRLTDEYYERVLALGRVSEEDHIALLVSHMRRHASAPVLA